MSAPRSGSAWQADEPSPARPPRRWFLHRTVVFLATLAVLGAGWFGYTSVSARGKIDPAVLAAIASRQPVNLWVELPFPPEEFHIRYLQDRGTVTGVQGRWIHLMRVKPSAAWSIARLYWVRRIRGEPGPQGAARAGRGFAQGRVAHAILPV